MILSSTENVQSISWLLSLQYISENIRLIPIPRLKTMCKVVLNRYASLEIYISQCWAFRGHIWVSEHMLVLQTICTLNRSENLSGHFIYCLFFCIWYYTVTYDGVFHILLVSIFNNHTFPLIKSQCVEVPSFLLSLMYLENVQKSLVKWGIREEKIEIWQWQFIPLSDSELTALGQSCPELSHKW